MKRQLDLHPTDSTDSSALPNAAASSLIAYIEDVLAASNGGNRSYTSLPARRAIEEAHRIERRVALQDQRIAQLEELASTDPLTGLLNRRGFQNAFQQVLSEARRYGEHGVVVYIDLDDFKPINDKYGHAAGDELLRHVGHALQNSIRDTDYVGRMGGDEFAVLLTRTARQNGISRAENLERLLNETHVPWEGRNFALSASFGIYAYTPADSGEEILKRADDAMYRIKRLRTGSCAVEGTT